MHRQSSSRNNRSKGIKVKHVLQICLLLAVCFWLIYQVKHSHEKRKEYKDEKVVGKVQNDGEVQRMGRKDLPRVTEIATDDDKNLDNEEEKETEEEENKHEEDEPEKEDSRILDREVDEAGRRGTNDDDDIDETESEKADAEHEDETKSEKVDADHEDETENTEAVLEHEDDELKKLETESKHEEEKLEDILTENDVRKVMLSESEHNEPEKDEDGIKQNHNDSDVALNDERSKKTQVSREEPYKADDASSEVDHGTQTSIPKTGNRTTGQPNQLFGNANIQQGNETETSGKDDDVEVQPREGGVNNTVNGTSSSGNVIELTKHELNLTNSDNSSVWNSTLPTLDNEKPENISKSTSGGVGNPVLNETQTTSDPNLLQNNTVKGTVDEQQFLGHNLSDNTNTTKLILESRNQNNVSGESLISSNTTSTSSLNTNGTNKTRSFESEKFGNSGTTGSDEKVDSHSSNVGANAYQHDPIDTSDTTLTQEEKEYRTDLGTLPAEIRNEVQNTDDSMAE